MAPPAATRKRIPIVAVVVGAAVIAALIGLTVYLSLPAPKPVEQGPSPEARAYLSKLQLSDVNMKATENFMKQQVVEINGKIANKGDRRLQRVDIYCIFEGTDGHPVYRERLPIVQSAKGGPLEPGQDRGFRLPFDTLPDTWNQAMPHLVIAQIVFGK